MAGWAAAAQAAGNIFSDWYNNDQAMDRQQDQQTFIQSERAIAQAFDERMSNTAIQRRAADLSAAGFNPMLSFTQGGIGATSPQATFQGGGIASPGGGNVNFDYASAKQALSSSDLMDAERNKKTAEKENIEADTRLKDSQRGVNLANIPKIAQDIEESQTRIQKLIADTGVSQASVGQIEAATAKLREELPQVRATTERLKTLANLDKAQVAQLAKQGNLTESQVGEIQQRLKANLPNLDAILKSLEARAQNLDMPRRGNEAAVHNSIVGGASALLKALNPLSGVISIMK